MNEEAQKSLSNLISLSYGNDKYQICIKDFLLSWWDEATFGIFDMHRLSCLDDEKRKDVSNVFSYLCLTGFIYPSQRTPYFEKLERLVNWEWENREELRTGERIYG